MRRRAETATVTPGPNLVVPAPRVLPGSHCRESGASANWPEGPPLAGKPQLLARAPARTLESMHIKPGRLQSQCIVRRSIQAAVRRDRAQCANRQVLQGQRGQVTLRVLQVRSHRWGLFKIAMEVLTATRLGDTETASALLLAAGADANRGYDQGCVTRLHVCMPRRDGDDQGFIAQIVGATTCVSFWPHADRGNAGGGWRRLELEGHRRVRAENGSAPPPSLRERARGMSLQVHTAASRIAERPRGNSLGAEDGRRRRARSGHGRARAAFG
jgi:hypothetical protein